MAWPLFRAVLLCLLVVLPTSCTPSDVKSERCTPRQAQGDNGLLYSEYLADTENYLCLAQKALSKFDPDDFIRDAGKVSGFRLLRVLTKYHPLPSFWRTETPFPSCKYSVKPRSRPRQIPLLFLFLFLLCCYGKSHSSSSSSSSSSSAAGGVEPTEWTSGLKNNIKTD